MVNGELAAAHSFANSPVATMMAGSAMDVPRDSLLILSMTPTTGSRARLERDTIDAIAAAQHGIVSRTQLRDAGISLCAIDNALKTGRVRLVHRGVYCVGPLLVQRAREMAALLVCGSASAISHASAAALLQLARPRTCAELIEVTVPGSCGRKVARLRIYRARLGDDEIVQLEGVRVTSAARTLLDLARILTHAELERALAAADRDRLVGHDEIQRLLQRYPRHRSAHKLRAFLACDTEPALTRSDAEAFLLALIRRAQLPAPLTNVRVHGFEVDMYWSSERLVVEVDGYAFHSSSRSFERDRRRDAVLTAAGLRVMRVTWRHMTREREATLARLAQALVRPSLLPSG